MDSENLLRTLSEISNLEKPLQSELPEKLDRDRSVVSRRVSALEERGLIERTPSGRSKVIELTEAGLTTVASDTPHGATAQRSAQQSDQAGQVRLHKVAVSFDIHEGPRTSEWVKRVGESSEPEVQEIGDGEAILYRASYQARFTPRQAIIMLEEIVGDSASDLVDEATRQALEHRDDLEARTPFSLGNQPQNFRIRTTERELAIIRHPFTELVLEDSQLEPEDVQFFTEDDNHEIWMDDSDGLRELESGRGAPYDEEDIQLLKEDLEHKVRNPEETRRRRKLPEELDDLEAKVSDIEAATRVLLARELRESRETEQETHRATERARGEEEDGTRETTRNSPSEQRQGRNGSEEAQERDGERIKDLEKKLQDRLEEFSR